MEPRNSDARVPDGRIPGYRIADLHIHSAYSHDSYLPPRLIVRKARAAGLTCIAVTDHGTIRGGVEAKRWAGKSPEIIVGTEIKTDCGDITGLGVSSEIRSTGWEDVIREIRDKGGVVVFPHPCRGHSDIEEIAQRVDYIECWNARSTPSQNEGALRLARHYGKPVIAGSDAHVASEIGSVRACIGGNSFQCQKILSARYASEQEIRKSRIISLVKQGKWGTLLSYGIRYLGR